MLWSITEPESRLYLFDIGEAFYCLQLLIAVAPKDGVRRKLVLIVVLCHLLSDVKHSGALVDVEGPWLLLSVNKFISVRDTCKSEDHHENGGNADK